MFPYRAFTRHAKPITKSLRPLMQPILGAVVNANANVIPVLDS
jgi:hypothetical protein